jgi:hypothetical protein
MPGEFQTREKSDMLRREVVRADGAGFDKLVEFLLARSDSVRISEDFL